MQDPLVKLNDKWREARDREGKLVSLCTGKVGAIKNIERFSNREDSHWDVCSHYSDELASVSVRISNRLTLIALHEDVERLDQEIKEGLLLCQDMNLDVRRAIQEIADLKPEAIGSGA